MELPLPPDVKVGCSEPGSCPQGFVCSETLGRCVLAESKDTQAPALAAPAAVDPERGCVGTEFAVHFAVTEPLHDAPLVELDLGGRREPLAGRPAADVEDGWVFVHTTTGSEPEGDAAVYITLADASGNVAQDLAGGLLRFDFTAPDLSGEVVVEPPLARAGTTVLVRFTVSEGLAEDPVVSVGERRLGRVLDGEAAQDDLDFVFRHLPAEGDGDGPRRFFIEMRDEAGNAAVRTLGGRLELDFAPPSLVGEPEVLTPAVRAGDTAAVRFAVDEELSGYAVVELRQGEHRVAMHGREPVGGEYTYTHEATEQEDGVCEVVVARMADRAGNVTREVHLGEVTFDHQPPGVEGEVVSSNADPALATRGDTVVATFSVDEPVGEPTVRLGGQAMERHAEAGEADVFAYRATVGEGGEDGPRAAVVRVEDAAGNVTSASLGEVRFDRAAPAVVSSGANPDPAGAGEVLVYSLNVNEALRGPPELHPDPPLELAGPQQYGTLYTWTHRVPDQGEARVHRMRVDLTDRAGNRAEGAEAAGLSLDPVPPVVEGRVSSDAPDPGRAGDGSQVRAVFSVGEPLLEPPVVTLGGLELQAAEEDDPEAGEHAYVRTIRAADGEGPRTLSVRVRDRARNLTTAELGTVVLDFSAPRVLSGTASPGLARGGQLVLVQVTLDEPAGSLDGEPVAGLWAFAEAGDDLDLGPATPGEDRRTLTWEHPVPAEAGEDRYSLEIARLCDELGNCRDRVTTDSHGQDLPGFAVDGIAPEVSALRASCGPAEAPATTCSAQPGHDLLTVEARFGEEPWATQVLVGAEAPSEGCDADPEAGPHAVRCTHRVVMGQAGGPRTVEVSARDRAGNRASRETAVRFDLDPPAVVSTLASPDPANLGSVVTLHMTTDEPLDVAASTLVVEGELDAWGPVRGDERRFSWSREVLQAREGTFDTAVSELCDTWGNCGGPVALAAVRIDSVPARIEGLRVCLDGDAGDGGEPCAERDLFSAQPGHDRLLVRFTLSQEASEVEVTVGEVRLQGCSREGLAHGCVHAVVDDGQAPRLRTVPVTVFTQDAAGNEDFASRTVSWDFEPPALAATAHLTRCDGWEPARVAEDDLWVKDGAACRVGDGSGCPYEGPECPYAYNDDGRAPVRVGLATTEPVVAGDGGVYLEETGTPLDVDEASTDTYLVAYYGSFAEDDGVRTVRAHVQDAAGNEARLEVGTLRFDSARPPAPDVNTKGRIPYERVPYGSHATNGEPRLVVTGAAGAVEAYPSGDHGEVRVWQPTPRNLLARGPSRPDGSFPDVLLGANPPEVLISHLDPAGNESVAAMVRDVRWTVSLGYKLPARTVENPTLLTTTPKLRAGLEQDPLSTVEPGRYELESLFYLDGSSVSREAAPSWEPLTGSRRPGSRWGHATAYDEARGKLVLYGGCHTEGLETECFDDLWEWDGRTGTWTERVPVGDRPDVLRMACMAYDAGRGTVLLFGGHSETGHDRDHPEAGTTWEWDGLRGTWTRVVLPVGSRPRGRTECSMTYDSGRGKVVLFGKDFAGCAGNDIWDWDGNAATWTERNPPDGVRAGWRGSPGLVYDSARRRVVVYGGMPYMAEHPDSTWEWNGEDGSWTLRSEDGDGPAGGLQWNALWDLDLAYDPVRGRVLLFGGAFYAECPWGYDGCEDWDDVSANRLWEWDGEAATWMRVPFGDPWPDSRRRLSVDYDTARGRLVVFGGVRSDFDSERERRVFAVEEYGDLWEWDAGGQTWLERTPGATRPAEREGHSLVYDSVRERVLLFGGHSASGCGEGGGAYCGQTWEWNLEAGGWADRTPVGGGPGPRTDAAMAYDPATGRALLFGGFNADDCGEEHGRDGTGLQTTACAWTWEWDGAAGTWTRLEPVTSPSPRWGHGMVHDPVEGRFVLFGGQHRRVRGNRPYWLNDTWVWWPEGNTWRSSAHADPEERKDHAMAFDEGRGKVVLHGGSGRSYWWVGDRSPWELDWGSWRWSRRADQDPLGALCSDHTMVFDPQRGKMVFFGGCLEEDYLEWDGDTGEAARWTARGARPGPRSNHAMVFDPALGKVLVSGGRGAPGQGDLVTWSWQGAADDIPAVLWRIPFSIAHTQPVDLLRVSAQAHAGGVGHPDAVATPGAHLLAWDTVQGDWLGAQVAGWRVLASNEAVADAPAPLEWTTRDPEAMRRTVFGEEEALHLVVAPLAPNGTGADAGQVAVDYLEATVEYRLVREFGWRFDQRCLCRYWHPGACCPQGHTDDDLTCAGWQPENVTTVCEDPEPGLWCMVLDADEPRLVSPPIEEDPRRYRYVEVRARNWNWDTSYEVRFTWHFEGEEGFPDGRGVTFDVEPSWDLAARIYRVPLDVPGWLAGDRLVRLRLDLPTPPVGEVFTLDWIRLSGDEYEVDCQNGEDDDADDLVDCEDPECATDPECEGR